MLNVFIMGRKDWNWIKTVLGSNLNTFEYMNNCSWIKYKAWKYNAKNIIYETMHLKNSIHYKWNEEENGLETGYYRKHERHAFTKDKETEATSVGITKRTQ